VTLVVYELVSNTGSDQLRQIVTTPSDRHTVVAAVRPHLVIIGTPAGSLKVDIQNSSGTVLYSSETIAISTITTANAFHGYVRFYLNAVLAASTNHYISLQSSGGYVYSDTSYVGWANDFDLRKYEASYSPSTGLDAALDTEIWSYNLITKGSYP